MNARRIAMTSLAALPLLAGTGTAFAATSPTPTTTTGCTSGALPTVIDGNPGVKAQSAEGVYLWHGKGGYQLRVTHPGKSTVTYTGTITVSRAIGTVTTHRDEKRDVVTVGPLRESLRFSFVNHGGIDGVGFTADCSATVVVNLKINGVKAPTSEVFLGKNRVSPTSVPFRIQRTGITAA